MIELLEKTLAAHGGLERWKEVGTVQTKLSASGGVWTLKGQPTLFADVTVDVSTTSQSVSATPFVHEGWHGTYSPDRVHIDDADGVVQEERSNPRASFDGHTLQTPWDHLHAIYFGGYALWTYVNVPFVLAEPGFELSELEPWTEGDEVWRRLHIVFPDRIATHSKEQVIYIDEKGLIRRHDYTAGITGGGPGAHFLHDYREFDGIVFPTLRKVFPRQGDNSAAPEPLLIKMEFASYSLS
ncbi:hypothetical protein ACEXQE_12885 [Herbiconiux sp. P17]|uniref:hypothetical protein n=1 Tax=Herbiconiux wuyangfengii TaxID=3342794 RepID=UPI0035B73964